MMPKSKNAALASARPAVAPGYRPAMVTANEALQFVLERGELVTSRRHVFLIVPLEMRELDLLILAGRHDEDAEEDDHSGTIAGV